MATSQRSISPQQRRRRVDIYFVLYICVLALFTIEPKNDTVQGLGASDEQINLTVFPRSLRYTVTVSPSGKVLREEFLDSILTVQVDGNIRDVSFSFNEKLEKPKAMSTDTMAFRKSNDIISMLALPQEQKALIRWRPMVPPDRKSHSYTAWINAEALPKTSYLFPRQIQARTLVEFKIEVKETTTEFGDGPQQTQRSDSSAVTSPFGTTVLTPNALSSLQGNGGQTGRGDTLYPVIEQARIDAPAGETWENTIKIFGGIPIKQPTITLSNGSSNYTISMRDNATIVVRGTAPMSGTMTVFVDVKSFDDKRSVRASFDVRTFPVLPATMVDRMYVGMTEIIDPQLPQSPNVEARLMESGTTREIQRANAKFSYTPDENDIGKTLELKRDVIMPNGNRVSIPTQARSNVVAPEPDITDTPIVGGGYKLSVRCYGMIKRNGVFKQNEINVDAIRFDGDNIKVEPLSAENKSVKPYFLQVFRIRKIDSNKPINIRRIVFSDLRGKSKEWKP